MRIIQLHGDEFIVADQLAGASFSLEAGDRANICFAIAGRQGLAFGPTTAEPVMREVFRRLQEFVTGGGRSFDMQREIQNAELTVSSKV